MGQCNISGENAVRADALFFSHSKRVSKIELLNFVKLVENINFIFITETRWSFSIDGELLISIKSLLPTKFGKPYFKFSRYFTKSNRWLSRTKRSSLFVFNKLVLHTIHIGSTMNPHQVLVVDRNAWVAGAKNVDQNTILWWHLSGTTIYVGSTLAAYDQLLWDKVITTVHTQSKKSWKLQKKIPCTA